MPRDMRYVAAGAHEHGHSRNIERSRYPRLRAVGTNIADRAGVGAGLLAGVVSRGRFGAAGGAMVGAGVSGLSSLPLLIEEHQASKNALKALKASGRFNDKEYREAKSALDAAYRTYVSRALQRATFAGGMASGNISLGAGMAGGGALQRMVTTRDTLKRFEGTRGSRRDERDVKHLAGVMGSRATHNYAKQPGGRINALYAAPHKHMGGLVSEKEYKKMLDEAADGKVHPKTLERGGVFIPRPTRR